MTLADLALQIRHDAESVRGAGAASYRDSLNSFVSLFAQNGARADIWHDGLEDPESPGSSLKLRSALRGIL